MSRTFLKIAFRNVAQDRGFSIVNIAALAVGIICFVLLLIWLQDLLNIGQLDLKVDSFFQILPGIILR